MLQLPPHQAVFSLVGLHAQELSGFVQVGNPAAVDPISLACPFANQAGNPLRSRKFGAEPIHRFKDGQDLGFVVAQRLTHVVREFALWAHLYLAIRERCEAEASAEQIGEQCCAIH